METEAALRLWGPSLHHKFYYRGFVGDGNLSAYTAVLQMNNGHGPYEHKRVMKEECVNHVSKHEGMTEKSKTGSKYPHDNKNRQKLQSLFLVVKGSLQMM